VPTPTLTHPHPHPHPPPQVTSWVRRVVNPFAERAKWKDVTLPGKWLQEFFDK